MIVSLAGIGVAQPPQKITQDKAADFAESLIPPGEHKDRVMKTLYRRTGVRSRSSVLLEESADEEVVQWFYPRSSADCLQGPTTGTRMRRYAAEAPPLAVAAARRALDDSAVEASAVTHLITVSCTGFASPGVEFALIRELQLPPTVARTNIGFMGCHGAINALRIGGSLAGHNESSRVLICAVEICSLHYQYGWQPDKIVANALFADGAAAAVLVPHHLRADQVQLRATGSCVLPGGEKEMNWLIGDHGFEMSLTAQVPEIISGSLRPWFEPWLGEQGLSIPEVHGWAIHPGGPRILSAVASALQLPDAALYFSREVLANCGNMSSPTVLFILQQLRVANCPLPWVAVAFGPGLVVEAALFVS